jgi:hypothetical protein
MPCPELKDMLKSFFDNQSFRNYGTYSFTVQHIYFLAFSAKSYYSFAKAAKDTCAMPATDLYSPYYCISTA